MKTIKPDDEKPAALSGTSQDPLGRLSAHYEQLLEDMQAPESKAAVEKLFTISSKADTDRSAQS